MNRGDTTPHPNNKTTGRVSIPTKHNGALRRRRIKRGGEATKRDRTRLMISS
eukprot:CAMPEP_0202028648 /NCGR_PEP_ID=MMETSP0905-20130828/63560_1 /ASSEMBLY_ACC=CAM_ASM_000554 /TAXON_ID=420261 /ORGANISM="Thalassiosira antarctica, Strain CCMP982" /LENGTH=51 /DNA_ID=CAMNT_0048592363 /DNA_START=776 /DNA_END=928 /DNA_ORIENTATION=+